MTIPDGARLGRYEIRSQLGKGGMGEVYLAQDTRLNRRVAIKVLPAALVNNHERLQRFEQEAQAASALNHPNILTIHEIGEEDGTHFIATEFIEGETLRRRMQKAHLEIKDALDITIQIAAALAAAHAAGIVHRDVKPENVMVRVDGLVKVLDFGLAKFAQTKPEAVDPEAPTRAQVNTQAGMIVGTVAYMSPEQARGLQVDARTDIFSLGVVFYEMLTGTPPFSGETASDVIAAILTKVPEPLSSYVPDIPKELERVINKSLRKDREERYQTAKDLLVDLRDQKGVEFEARPGRSAASKTAAEAERRNARTATGAASAGEVGRHRSAAVLTLAVLSSAIIALGYWYFGPHSATRPVESIAVLPFVNQGGNADTEYLSDGITETLISNLSRLPTLKVKARSSVFRYKGQEADAQTVGRELNVQAVLNGRVAQRGQDLLLYIELVDAQTDNILWKADYNRPMTNLASLQGEIARDVSQKLITKLTGADERRVAKNYTENTEAYKLYLLGRFYWNKRTGETLKKSIEYFNQAIEVDPDYALAYVGLSDTYYLLPIYSAETSRDSISKAKAAAKKALEIDDTLAEAHTSLAHTLLFDWNFPESIREFQRAITLNPNYANGHQWYGLVLRSLGRFDEAFAELKQAQEIDPLSLNINADLGTTYLYAGDYDRAIEQLRKTVEMDKNFAYTHEMLGTTYEMKGSFQEAIEEYRLARQLSDNPRMLGLLGHAYATSGRRAAALKTLEELEEVAKQRHVPAYAYAFIYAGLGEKDQAFQWLERSYQERDYVMVRLKIDPLLDPLRGDPRFEDLLRRVGLPQ